MLKKLAVLSLVLVPIVFATSTMDFTEINDLKEKIVYLTNCICNPERVCPCPEDCLYDESLCYKVNTDYNNINDTVVCPYSYCRENYVGGCGRYQHRGMWRWR